MVFCAFLGFSEALLPIILAGRTIHDHEDTFSSRRRQGQQASLVLVQLKKLSHEFFLRELVPRSSIYPQYIPENTYLLKLDEEALVYELSNFVEVKYNRLVVRYLTLDLQVRRIIPLLPEDKISFQFINAKRSQMESILVHHVSASSVELRSEIISQWPGTLLNQETPDLIQITVGARNDASALVSWLCARSDVLWVEPPPEQVLTQLRSVA